LKGNPKKYIAAIAPKSEIGIAMAIINVDLIDIRNKKTTNAANKVPSTI
jgi:hypothetical protein